MDGVGWYESKFSVSSGPICFSLSWSWNWGRAWQSIWEALAKNMFDKRKFPGHKLEVYNGSFGAVNCYQLIFSWETDVRSNLMSSGLVWKQMVNLYKSYNLVKQYNIKYGTSSPVLLEFITMNLFLPQSGSYRGSSLFKFLRFMFSCLSLRLELFYQ